MDFQHILDKDNDSSLVCRLCLVEEDDLVDIFDPKGYEGFRLWEIIKELLQMEVSKEDGLPGTVCKVCIGRVKEFKLFKTLCIRAKISFLTMIACRGMVTSLVPLRLSSLSPQPLLKELAKVLPERKPSEAVPERKPSEAVPERKPSEVVSKRKPFEAVPERRRRSSSGESGGESDGEDVVEITKDGARVVSNESATPIGTRRRSDSRQGWKDGHSSVDSSGTSQAGKDDGPSLSKKSRTEEKHSTANKTVDDSDSRKPSQEDHASRTSNLRNGKVKGRDRKSSSTPRTPPSLSGRSPQPQKEAAKVVAERTNGRNSSEEESDCEDDVPVVQPANTPVENAAVRKRPGRDRGRRSSVTTRQPPRISSQSPQPQRKEVAKAILERTNGGNSSKEDSDCQEVVEEVVPVLQSANTPVENAAARKRRGRGRGRESSSTTRQTPRISSQSPQPQRKEVAKAILERTNGGNSSKEDSDCQEVVEKAPLPVSQPLNTPVENAASRATRSRGRGRRSNVTPRHSVRPAGQSPPPQKESVAKAVPERTSRSQNNVGRVEGGGEGEGRVAEEEENTQVPPPRRRLVKGAEPKPITKQQPATENASSGRRGRQAVKVERVSLDEEEPVDEVPVDSSESDDSEARDDSPGGGEDASTGANSEVEQSASNSESAGGDAETLQFQRDKGSDERSRKVAEVPRAKAKRGRGRKPFVSVSRKKKKERQEAAKARKAEPPVREEVNLISVPVDSSMDVEESEVVEIDPLWNGKEEPSEVATEGPGRGGAFRAPALDATPSKDAIGSFNNPIRAGSQIPVDKVNFIQVVESDGEEPQEVVPEEAVEEDPLAVVGSDPEVIQIVKDVSAVRQNVASASNVVMEGSIYAANNSSGQEGIQSWLKRTYGQKSQNIKEPAKAVSERTSSVNRWMEGSEGQPVMPPEEDDMGGNRTNGGQAPKGQKRTLSDASELPSPPETTAMQRAKRLAVYIYPVESSAVDSGKSERDFVGIVEEWEKTFKNKPMNDFLLRLTVAMLCSGVVRASYSSLASHPKPPGASSRGNFGRAAVREGTKVLWKRAQWLFEVLSNDPDMSVCPMCSAPSKGFRFTARHLVAVHIAPLPVPEGLAPGGAIGNLEQELSVLGETLMKKRNIDKVVDLLIPPEGTRRAGLRPAPNANEVRPPPRGDIPAPPAKPVNSSSDSEKGTDPVTVGPDPGASSENVPVSSSDQPEFQCCWCQRIHQDMVSLARHIALDHTKEVSAWSESKGLDEAAHSTVKTDIPTGSTAGQTGFTAPRVNQILVYQQNDGGGPPQGALHLTDSNPTRKGDIVDTKRGLGTTGVAVGASPLPGNDRDEVAPSQSTSTAGGSQSKPACIRCHICKQIYPTFNEAWAHFSRDHSTEKQDDGPKVEVADGKPRKDWVKCTKCADLFKTVDECWAHFKRVHFPQMPEWMRQQIISKLGMTKK